MEIFATNNSEYVNEIVDLHMNTFTGFFLTFLGRGFLKTLYQGFMENSFSGIIVALDNDKVVGFCAYSEDISRFYKYLIKKRLLKFAWYAMGAFVRKPNVLFRLLRAFTYSKTSERQEPYIELSSIGVAPYEKNHGIGSAMVRKICEMYNSQQFQYIKLETDRDNNEGANIFYQKNGFILADAYETPEGRRMNEYRYYLGE